MLLREAFRALADKIDVRTFAQNLACGADRIFDALDAAHAPGTQRGAIHEERVHLDFAFAVEEAAAPGVEGFVVFENDESFLDGVQSRAASLQHNPARCEGVTHALFVRFHHVVGHGPRAAVDDENRTHSEGSLEIRSVSLASRLASQRGATFRRGGVSTYIGRTAPRPAVEVLYADRKSGETVVAGDPRLPAAERSNVGPELGAESGCKDTVWRSSRAVCAG